MSYYIGLDLGGTNVKAGIVDDHGQPIARLSVPTQGERGPDVVIEVLIDVIKQLTAEAGMSLKKITGIGLGVPGVMDIAKGVCIAAPNIKDFRNIPIGRLIAERTGKPAILENDANAAAMGEYWVGSGKDRSIKHLAMLTLGTGIGGGIVMDGHVFHGGNDIGAEIGHMIVQVHGEECACGQRGCLEAYASASSTVRRTKQAISEGGSSSLEDKGDNFTAKDVFDAAKAGDPLAIRITEQSATYLGVAVVSLCRLLDPQMIVFAGGMMLAGDFLFDCVRRATDENYWHLTQRRVQIVPAQLGNDAGFIGAAAVAWDAHQTGVIG
jgi:glucokinase